MSDSPALVLNDLGDLLAWTPAYSAIGGPLGILDAEPPNFARYTFCDPRARRHYPDWAFVADQQVANLRSATHCHDAALDALIAELHERAGDEFTRRWEARPVARKRLGAKRIDHPWVGELRLAFETMELADRDRQRLVVYLPDDPATAEALDRLGGIGRGRLRVVDDPAG